MQQFRTLPCLVAIPDAPRVQAAQLHTLRFPNIPLIEPDRQISRIRLSDKTSRASAALVRREISLRSPLGDEGGFHSRSRSCPAIRERNTSR